MIDHERISKLFRRETILLPFAGPLGRTVPAIFKTASYPVTFFTYIAFSAMEMPSILQSIS